MKRTKPNWIVVENGTMAMLCQRCGARQQPKLPIAVAAWLRISRSFQKVHRQCAAPVKETTRQHFLKTYPQFFDAVARGDKTFEVRAKDRDYRVGDLLTLQRYHPTTGYDSAEIDKRNTYIIPGGQFGVAATTCVLALGEVPMENL